LRGLIFDFDGTIAETEQDGHRIAYNEAFKDNGLEWNWDRRLYHELLFVAGGKERIRHYLDAYQPTLPAGAPPDLIERIHRAKIKRFSAIAERLPLRPGVQRLIREAKGAGLGVGIATTASLQGVESVLSQDPALHEAFDVIAAGDVARHKKPAPDVYLWALDRLGLRAEDCIAIEDSSVGLSAALAAKIATLITTNDDTRTHRFDGALAVLSDLGEPGSPARTFSGPPPPGGVADLRYLNAIFSPDGAASASDGSPAG
jgi:HAD superfamily hydrolase (TIGR01509 family)